jgi:hypothetical protein
MEKHFIYLGPQDAEQHSVFSRKMSYFDESTVHSNLYDILKVAHRQPYSTMHFHCHVTAVTFQNKLCQSSDIPEQTMSE